MKTQGARAAEPQSDSVVLFFFFFFFFPASPRLSRLRVYFFKASPSISRAASDPRYKSVGSREAFLGGMGSGGGGTGFLSFVSSLPLGAGSSSG